MDRITAYLTPARRKRLYFALVAAQPLVVFYGHMTSAEAAMWVDVVAAALVGQVAAANVPASSE